RRFVHGQGALIQATAPTLTSESPENLILTPVADIIQALPTTNVWAGRKFCVTNLASAFYVTVKASNGDIIAPVPPGAEVLFKSTQDTPTALAHWVARRNYQIDQGASYINGTGITGASASSVKSVTIKGGSLNAVGRRVRISYLIALAASATVSISFAGISLFSGVGTASKTYRGWMEISYLSATTINWSIASHNLTDQNVGNMASGEAATVSSLASDQTLVFFADGTHNITVYEIVVYPEG
ncbi:MAG: hypothetical protein KGL39_07000, partial [Patescibacteria group bacterium]|nr:hypothetical protein [Patescibacteria group bacterium]